MTPEPGVSKACTKCGDVKLLGEFPAEKRRKDGKRSICKACANVAYAEKAKRWKAEGKTSPQLAYMLRNKDQVRAQQATYHKEYYKRPEVRERLREYRRQRTKERNASSKRWAANNPEKATAVQVRRDLRDAHRIHNPPTALVEAITINRLIKRHIKNVNQERSTTS